MVTWILGRSGVGKTTALQQKLNELTGYERVYYLVPEQSSLELERKLSGAYPNVKVVSFRRLTNEIFRAFGGVAGTYMTPTRQTAMIYRVLAEKKKELCYYGSTRSTMSFVTRLAEVFSEFAMAGLTRQQVLPVIDQSGRQDWQQKYRDLFLLYEAYCAHLDGENRWAAEDLAVATDLARERGFFANTPVLLDGFISCVAALVAVRLCPDANDYLLATHVSAEPAGHWVLEALGKQAPIHAGMRLGEGSGAVCAVPLLDLALAVYRTSGSFLDAAIDPYQPLK